MNSARGAIQKKKKKNRKCEMRETPIQTLTKYKNYYSFFIKNKGQNQSLILKCTLWFHQKKMYIPIQNKMYIVIKCLISKMIINFDTVIQ